MSIDEASRRELWNSLRDTIGATHADTLMTMLPDQPLPEFATRQDMAALTVSLRSEIRAEGEAVRADLRKDFADLRGEFGELRAEFGQLEGSLRAEFGQLEGSLRSEFGELRAEFARQTLTLGLTLGSLIIAVLGTILTLGFTGAFA